jgi:CheY-like chemotaxis protein
MDAGRILCIDDEELGLTVRKMILESEGFEVSTASDGLVGLQLFSSAQFDLVLLDHSMPGMNGGEIAREIRRIRPATPILLLSAYVTLPDDDVKLVDAYVTKGESTETLLAIIRQLLQYRGKEGHS